MLWVCKQAATVDGVLGGFGHVSSADIRESERFLSKVLIGSEEPEQRALAVACTPEFARGSCFRPMR